MFSVCNGSCAREPLEQTFVIGIVPLLVSSASVPQHSDTSGAAKPLGPA